MTDNQSDHIIQRLDRLERGNRFWKRIAGALFILLTMLTTLVLIGGIKTILVDEVRTKHLVVVDKEGKPRIELGKEEYTGDAFGLTMRTSEGVIGANLFTGGYVSSALYLYDLRGDYHAGLAVKSNNDPYNDSLEVEFDLLGQRLKDSIWNKDGGSWNFDAQQSIRLSVTSNLFKDTPEASTWASVANFEMRSKKIDARISLSQPDKAVFSFHHYEKLPPVGALDMEGGELELRMNEGRPAVSLSDTASHPGLVLGHSSLKYENGVVEERPASSLVLFNKDGKVIWNTP